MKYYTAETKYSYTWQYEYQAIMLSEKNRSYKNTYNIRLFTKNKAKSYICFRGIHVC